MVVSRYIIFLVSTRETGPRLVAGTAMCISLRKTQWMMIELGAKLITHHMRPGRLGEVPQAWLDLRHHRVQT